MKKYVYNTEETIIINEANISKRRALHGRAGRVNRETNVSMKKTEKIGSEKEV